MRAMYKKRVIFLILVIVLAALPAAFGEELIFDGWVDHEEKFVAEGKEYNFFAVSKDLLSAKLHAGRYGTLFFSKGDSQESGPIRVEYDDYQEKTGANDPDPRRNAEYHIKIFKKQANIEFWREIDKEYPLYLDRFNIIIYIENEAGEPIKPVYITQKLPDELKKVGDVLFTRGSGEKESTTTWDASLDDNKAIKWSGVIKEGERIKLMQEVEVLHKKTNVAIQVPEATAEYTYQSLAYKKTIEKKEIYLGDPLSMSISKNKDEVSYGDKIRYTIKLTNKHTKQELKVTKLAFLLENTTKLYSKDNDIKQVDKKNNHYFVWTGRLAPSITKELIMDLNLYGNSGKTITLISEHEYKDLQLTKQVSDEVEIDIEKLEVYITTDKVTYTAGENATIKFFMENTNANIPFQNVKIELSSEFFPTERMVLGIASRQNELVKEMKLKIPEVEKTSIKTMTMAGTYETASHVPFEFSVTKAITITAEENQEEIAGKTSGTIGDGDNQEYINEDGSIPEEAFIQPGENVVEQISEVAVEEQEYETVKIVKEETTESITSLPEQPEKKIWLMVFAVIIIAVLVGGSSAYVVLRRKQARKFTKETVKDIKEEIEDEVQRVLKKIR